MPEEQKYDELDRIQKRLEASTGSSLDRRYHSVGGTVPLICIVCEEPGSIVQGAFRTDSVTGRKAWFCWTCAGAVRMVQRNEATGYDPEREVDHG